MQTAVHGDKVIDFLVQRKAVKADALLDAMEESKTTGTRIEKILVLRSLVTGADMALALAEYLSIPPISLAHFNVDNQLIEKIPTETLTRHSLVPLCRTGNLLLDMRQNGTRANQFTFRAKLLAQLQNLATSLIEIFRQLLLLRQIANRQRDVVGYR